MNEEIITSLVGLVTVSLGFFFFYFPWQTLVIDQTRQRLFEIRDSWFDYTVSLESEGDKKAAEAVRLEINYLIRLTHKVTFPVLIWTAIARAIFSRPKPVNTMQDLVSRFKTSAAAKMASKVIFDSFSVVTWGMIRRSMPALLIGPAIVAAIVVMYATQGGIKLNAKNGASKLDPLIQSLGNSKDLAMNG